MNRNRIVSLVLCGSLCLALTACGKGPSTATPPPATSPVPSQPTTATPAPAPTDTTSGGIAVDDGILTVDLTFPASMFEGQDMSAFDADAYVSEQGFDKAVVNSDGSITVTMTKAKHEELLADMAVQVEQGFAEMIGAEDSPYIKDITYSENYKTITAVVDRTAYEAEAINMTPLVLGMSGMMYQVFTGDENRVEVIIQDEVTGDTVTSAIYPDDMGGTN